MELMDTDGRRYVRASACPAGVLPSQLPQHPTPRGVERAALRPAGGGQEHSGEVGGVPGAFALDGVSPRHFGEVGALGGSHVPGCT